MNKTNGNSPDASKIRRQKAEELYKDMQEEASPSLTEADLAKLYHELQVHQIELELQNEELALAKQAAESAIENLNLIYDFSPAGYFSLTKDGTILELNNSGAALLGKQLSASIGVNFRLFVQQESLKVFDQFLTDTFSVNTKQTCELKFGTKENSPKYVQIEGLITQTEHKCLVSALDITKLKLADEAIREQEQAQLYHDLFEKIHAVQILIDPANGRIVDANSAAAKFYGYTVAQLKAMEISEINTLPPEKIKTILAESISEHKKYFIFKHRLGNGEIRDVEVYSSPIEKDGNNLIYAIIHDITERIASENALRLSEDRFQSVAAASGIWVWEVDKEGMYTYVSPTEESILGYTVSEVVGKKHFYDFFLPDTKEDLKKGAFAAFARKESIANFENPNIHKDGHVVILETSGVPILDTDGNLLGYRGADKDISDRKAAEASLRESEIQFRTLSEYSMVGIVRIEDNLLQYVNPALANIMDCQPEDLIGKSFLPYIHPDDREMVLDNMRQGMALEMPSIQYEARVLRKDGEVRHVLVLGAVSDFGDRRINMGSVLDITERKQAEEKIIILSRSVEQCPVSIVITTPSGEIEYANPKFAEVTGYTGEEVLGKNPRILQSGRNTKQEYQYLWETILSGKEWHGEFCNKKKNGEIYWEEASISPLIDDKGNIIHFVAVKEDITVRKQMEDDLTAAKEKAEEVSRLKSSFLANMSHELRTPMIGILGFSELLEEQPFDEKTKGYVKLISQSGKRLMDTLNLILDLSKIEADRLTLDKMNTDILPIITDVCHLFEAAANKKKIHISIESSVASPVLFVDGRIFGQVINNLVNNAIKYTEEGSIKITVNTETAVPDNLLVIHVSDTGIGIAKKDQDLIWDEFRQVSEGFGRSYEGTGLGLSITKKFVEKMGGTITVESELNAGTKFSVKFPAMQKSNEIQVPPIERNSSVIKEKSRDTNGQRPTVLYVEDDEIALVVVKTLLADICTIHHAENSERALQKVNEVVYDAILMDINLVRGPDGIQTTRMIRKIESYKLTPIVAITAFAMVGDREEFLAAGCTHYISKPFEKEPFQKLMRQVLEIK